MLTRIRNGRQVILNISGISHIELISETQTQDGNVTCDVDVQERRYQYKGTFQSLFDQVRDATMESRIRELELAIMYAPFSAAAADAKQSYEETAKNM